MLTKKQYASATSDNLKLAGTGTGDIAEMTESLADDEAAYAYVRMKLGNDEYSERVKFAFVVWQGQYLQSLLPFFCSSLFRSDRAHCDVSPLEFVGFGCGVKC